MVHFDGLFFVEEKYFSDVTGSNFQLVSRITVYDSASLSFKISFQLYDIFISVFSVYIP